MIDTSLSVISLLQVRALYKQDLILPLNLEVYGTPHAHPDRPSFQYWSFISVNVAAVMLRLKGKRHFPWPDMIDEREFEYRVHSLGSHESFNQGGSFGNAFETSRHSPCSLKSCHHVNDRDWKPGRRPRHIIHLPVRQRASPQDLPSMPSLYIRQSHPPHHCTTTAQHLAFAICRVCDRWHMPSMSPRSCLYFNWDAGRASCKRALG